MITAAKPQGAELLEYVLRVSRRLAEHRSLEPLLSFAIDEILKLVGAEQGFIVLIGEDGELDFRVGRDQAGKDIVSGVDQISRSILQTVADSGRALQVSNAMTDPRFGEAMSVVQLRLRSVMCVPLASRQQTIGAIFVENRSIRNRFRKEDIAPLELFANQAAVAIENATLNDNLRQAHQHLQEIDRLKSDFIILVSHELKTPLTVVNASAHLIKKLIERSSLADDREIDERILRTGERLEKAVYRVNMTLDEIIQVFSAVAGRLTLDFQQTFIADMVQSLVNDLAPICTQRSLTVRLDQIDRLPPIQGDYKKLKTALKNVIGNAIKYTPDGGEIIVRGRILDDGIEIIVEDEGVGIPPAEQERVFDLFHILGSLTTHFSSKHAFRGGGLGLGLPICRAIVEAHGGTVSLTSPIRANETAPGTACMITLPRHGPAMQDMEKST